MEEYVFSFGDTVESDGEKYNCLDDIVYGLYNTEEEAILDAMRMYEDCGYEFTHLFVGKAERFVPRIYSESILEDMAQLAEDDGYDDSEYLTDVNGKHMRELDKLLTEAYRKWENMHPEYRNSDYSMTNEVRYSISFLKEKLKNMRKEGETMNKEGEINNDK